MKNLELCECGKIAIDTRVSTWDDVIKFSFPEKPKHLPKELGGCRKNDK